MIPLERASCSANFLYLVLLDIFYYMSIHFEDCPIANCSPLKNWVFCAPFISCPNFSYNHFSVQWNQYNETSIDKIVCLHFICVLIYTSRRVEVSSLSKRNNMSYFDFEGVFVKKYFLPKKIRKTEIIRPQIPKTASTEL